MWFQKYLVHKLFLMGSTNHLNIRFAPLTIFTLPAIWYSSRTTAYLSLPSHIISPHPRPCMMFSLYTKPTLVICGTLSYYCKCSKDQYKNKTKQNKLVLLSQLQTYFFASKVSNIKMSPDIISIVNVVQ